MLGRESLEDKLRKDGFKTAPATVLDREDGADIALGIDDNLSTGVPKWMDHEGDIQKHSYTLRVEPEGAPSFDARVAIRENHLHGLTAPDVGDHVVVLFDPDDQDKVALDVEATKAQAAVLGQQGDRVIRPGETRVIPAEPSASDVVDKLKELADLRDRGALTDGEFESEKAKLLNE